VVGDGDRLRVVRKRPPDGATELLLEEVSLGQTKRAPQFRQRAGGDVEHGVPDALPLLCLRESGAVHGFTSSDT
jgi:hypothetical protein